MARGGECGPGCVVRHDSVEIPTNDNLRIDHEPALLLPLERIIEDVIGISHVVCASTTVFIAQIHRSVFCADPVVGKCECEEQAQKLWLDWN